MNSIRLFNFKIFLQYFLGIQLAIGFNANAQKISTNKQLFEDIISNYIDQFKEIPNNCGAKPFYKIYFLDSNDTIKFWIGAHLGQPGRPVVPPPEYAVENPIELKGIININGHRIVLYDFKKSTGHNVYNPKKVNKKALKKIKYVPESCVAGVITPEAWCISIINNSMQIVNKREPFIIK